MEFEGPFERVLTAARAGEGWALAELFRDLHPRIRRYLRSLAPYAADDVASDTWLDVVRALDRFRGSASDLRALAFSIARTRIAEIRDNGSTETVDLEALAATPAIRMAAPAPASDLGPALSALDTDAALGRILTLPIDEVARTVGKAPREIRSLERDALQRLAVATSQERATT